MAGFSQSGEDGGRDELDLTRGFERLGYIGEGEWVDGS